jgi:DNA-binding response OmpR family regulator
MEPIPSTPTAIEFGRFRVLPHRRELLADGRPINPGGRVFAAKRGLIDAHEAVVSKDALMARVSSSQTCRFHWCRADDRYREGFRMPAGRDLSTGAAAGVL